MPPIGDVWSYAFQCIRCGFVASGVNLVLTGVSARFGYQSSVPFRGPAQVCSDRLSFARNQFFLVSHRFTSLLSFFSSRSIALDMVSALRSMSLRLGRFTGDCP
jgi:uncharacterized membrane protein YjdF